MITFANYSYLNLEFLDNLNYLYFQKKCIPTSCNNLEDGNAGNEIRLGIPFFLAICESRIFSSTANCGFVFSQKLWIPNSVWSNWEFKHCVLKIELDITRHSSLFSRCYTRHFCVILLPNAHSILTNRRGLYDFKLVSKIRSSRNINRAATLHNIFPCYAKEI